MSEENANCAVSGPVGGRPLKRLLITSRGGLCIRLGYGLCDRLGRVARKWVDGGDEFIAVQFIGNELDMEPLLTVAGVCGRVERQVCGRAEGQVEDGWGEEQ